MCFRGQKVCFPAELQSWAGIDSELCALSSVLTACYLHWLFSDAHMQFFPTATQALPWNSQKPQCWQWQIWPSFLQRKLKNLSKNSFDLMKLASTWPSKHQDKIHLICHSCRYCLTVVHKSAVGNWEVLIFTDLFFGDFHSSTHFWWHWIEVALCTLYKNMEFFFPKSIEVGC